MDVLKPPSEIRNIFSETVDPIFGNTRNNLIESHTLAELRDTLLPKLLSGELPVSAAEAHVEATLES